MLVRIPFCDIGEKMDKVNKERFYDLVNRTVDIFDNIIENVMIKTKKIRKFDIWKNCDVDGFETKIYTTKIKIPYREELFSIKLNNYIVDYMFNIKDDVMVIKFNNPIELGDKITIVYSKSKEEWTWTFGGEENYG